MTVLAGIPEWIGTLRKRLAGRIVRVWDLGESRWIEMHLADGHVGVIRNGDSIHAERHGYTDADRD